jgi:transcriptional antiterminator RfaH
MNDAEKTDENPCGGWFVVWTESRAEKRVAARIVALGLESWMPTVTERRKWSDRWKNVALPAFPGYLFARGELSHVAVVLRTPGVLAIVRSGSKPARLSDAFVASLRETLDRDGLAATPVERVDYAPCDEVIVQDGPLIGARGVVRELRGARQLVIWVKEIGRGISFTLDAASVSPCT